MEKEMGQWQLRDETGKPVDDAGLLSFDTAYQAVRNNKELSAWKTDNGNGHMMIFNIVSQTVVVVRVTQKTLPNGNGVYGSRP